MGVDSQKTIVWGVGGGGGQPKDLYIGDQQLKDLYIRDRQLKNLKTSGRLQEVLILGIDSQKTCMWCYRW